LKKVFEASGSIKGDDVLLLIKGSSWFFSFLDTLAPLPKLSCFEESFCRGEKILRLSPLGGLKGVAVPGFGRCIWLCYLSVVASIVSASLSPLPLLYVLMFLRLTE